MSIREDSRRTIKEGFDACASGHADWGFAKTHIVLQLLPYEGEKLLSRSQARRLLSRMDQFMEGALDFDDVACIGQAFAERVFRVFQSAHPGAVLHCINTTDDIDKMIAGVRAQENALISGAESRRRGMLLVPCALITMAQRSIQAPFTTTH